MSPELKRRFKIWGICLLIVVVSASILFVVHVVSGPSESFISVNFASTNLFLNGTNSQAISMQVSNRMSFKVMYAVETEGLHKGYISGLLGFHRHVFAQSRKYTSCTLEAHSQTSDFLLEPSEGLRVSVRYLRLLNPIEMKILPHFPWLLRYYFQHPHYTPAYEWKGTDGEELEHKVIVNTDPQNITNGNIGPLVSDMAKDGWMLIRRESDTNFYFRRFKR